MQSSTSAHSSTWLGTGNGSEMAGLHENVVVLGRHGFAVYLRVGNLPSFWGQAE
jgi:hypothetical protein